MVAATAAVAARDVAVIGAGIVGVACALYLQRDGHRVTLIDRGGPGDGASYGNAGAVVTGACAPLAMPGVLSRVPGMLRDPLGPLVLRWRYLPFIAPWLIRFVSASTPERVERISQDLMALLSRTEACWRDLLRQTGSDAIVRPVGWLKVYETEAAFARTAAERALMTRRGAGFELLGADELRQLEPALAPIFRRGIFQPDCLFVTNPKRLVESFAADFVSRGGRLERGEVVDFRLDPPGRQVITDRGAYDTEVIVLAAGAWSRGLARKLGARVPLDTERGYHLMLPPVEPGLGRPTVNGDHGFVLCPMEQGIRLTSQVELAGLAAPPDFRRIRGLLPAARRMLPSLVPEERSAWLGFRPSLPDSKPVIGPSPRHRGVYFAFGHQHLGITLGPVTGRLIGDLVAGREPGIDLEPFRAGR